MKIFYPSWKQTDSIENLFSFLFAEIVWTTFIFFAVSEHLKKNTNWFDRWIVVVSRDTVFDALVLSMFGESNNSPSSIVFYKIHTLVHNYFMFHKILTDDSTDTDLFFFRDEEERDRSCRLDLEQCDWQWHSELTVGGII